MNQSNAIFGALLIAYIVFITVRGELPSYIELLKGNGAVGQNGGVVASVTGGIFGSLLGSVSGAQPSLFGAGSTSSSTPGADGFSSSLFG